MSLEISKQLKQADLNLLITFHLLLKHKSVKKVADELFLSQSAVSRALGRLTATFDDELFTRTYSGLVPTDKATIPAQDAVQMPRRSASPFLQYHR